MANRDSRISLPLFSKAAPFHGDRSRLSTSREPRFIPLLRKSEKAAAAAGTPISLMPAPKLSRREKTTLRRREREREREREGGEDERAVL
jgi:hypothetical protein